MQYSTIFFDLDDTLYPSTNGLWDAIRDRMNLYMEERLNMPVDEISDLRRKYFIQYGTTLRGLQFHHDVDADEFLAFVHDLPLKSFLNPDPALRKLIQSLPQKKWIFTNADAAHAKRVLSLLGVEDCFDGIIDVRANNFLCKPEPEVYRSALVHAGEEDPNRCVFLDDSARNLAPATQLGFYTVLVGVRESNPVARCTIPSIHALPEQLPELWNHSGKSK
jgi:putative hydrolase of the HAD superfamily